MIVDLFLGSLWIPCIIFSPFLLLAKRMVDKVNKREREDTWGKMDLIPILLLLLLFTGTAQAQSTFTVKPIELTQEQKDWTDIMKLEPDGIIALKAAKIIEKYDYLKDTINKRQALLQIQDHNDKRRKRLKIGHASHIYPCHIENEVKKIEAEGLAIERNP